MVVVAATVVVVATVVLVVATVVVVVVVGIELVVAAKLVVVPLVVCVVWTESSPLPQAAVTRANTRIRSRPRRVAAEPRRACLRCSRARVLWLLLESIG
jgi:hypothetical protein